MVLPTFVVGTASATPTISLLKTTSASAILATREQIVKTIDATVPCRVIQQYVLMVKERALITTSAIAPQDNTLEISARFQYALVSLPTTRQCAPMDKERALGWTPVCATLDGREISAKRQFAQVPLQTQVECATLVDSAPCLTSAFATTVMLALIVS